MYGTLLEHVFLSRVDPHLDASDDLLHFTVSKLACCDNGLFSRQYLLHGSLKGMLSKMFLKTTK